MHDTHLLNSATLGTHWNAENNLCLATSHFKTSLWVSCGIYSSLERCSKQECYQHVCLGAVDSNWKKKKCIQIWHIKSLKNENTAQQLCQNILI